MTFITLKNTWYTWLRCPNPEDKAVDLLQNGVSTSSRFSFEMFIFTSNSTKVYLHCAIHLCLQTDNHCSVVSLQIHKYFHILLMDMDIFIGMSTFIKFLSKRKVHWNTDIFELLSMEKNAGCFQLYTAVTASTSRGPYGAMLTSKTLTPWLSFHLYFSTVTLNTTIERADLWTSMTVLPFLWVHWCGLKVTNVTL